MQKQKNWNGVDKMKIRVSDYLTQELTNASGNKIFMITGGMIMFLTDAVYKLHEEKGLDFYCFHHEQATSMAAEAYARTSGKLGVAYVTAGPAALNTLTGVVGAYVDRSPCIVVSGQSKVSQAHVTVPRQFSLQGFNTLPIFEKVTKYAVLLDDISKIKYEIHKAIHIACAQPLGPVWIECPIDIQGAYFDPDDYEDFIPSSANTTTYKIEQLKDIVNTLKNADRPAILAGAGIRQANLVDAFNELVKLLKIPVTTTRMGMDIIDHENEYFVGRPGTYGDRTGNFTVQNSDVLLVLGCRLGIGVIGHDYEQFAPDTQKIIIDIDPKEFDKPSISAKDTCIEANLQDLIPQLIDELKSSDYNKNYTDWLELTHMWKNKYQVDLEEYANLDEINSYHFMGQFAKKVGSNALFSVDTGSCFHVHAQAFKVKYGQRHIITGGLSTMGYSPSSVGVAISAIDTEKKDIYCISGDGSIQMNLQEFQTIAYYKLPIKTIILNNNGYLLIRLTQKNFCENRLIGESNKNGVGFPSMEKVADLYGIKYMSIRTMKELHSKIDELIAYDGPMICDVFTPKEQLLIPRVASKKLNDGKMVSMPYDDMFPFLERDEYEINKKMALKCKS